MPIIGLFFMDVIFAKPGGQAARAALCNSNVTILTKHRSPYEAGSMASVYSGNLGEIWV